MRALHFCFLLHHPYELNPAKKWERGYYGGEKCFQEANEEQYQPLLALLERNVQRYPRLRISLAISGMWLEQAERWDASLIKRIRKLVQSGNVELVTLPYYYSAAAFFEMEEFAAQVKQMRTKLEQVFGGQSRALSLPEACYHNKIARWAGKNDFEVVLAGDAAGSLGWRDPNRVFLARGCENVKILFQNAKLTNMLVSTDERVMREKKYDVEMFQKQLDLEFLRGELINIYLSAKLIGRRDEGIISFFDDLFKIWMETPGRKLVGVDDCLKLPATMEVSVKKTASSLGEARREYALPDYWKNMEIERQHQLYDLRDRVLDTHDKDLYIDFARLTARDYVAGGEEYNAIFEDIRQKVAKFVHDKMADDQPAKKGMTASTKVKINFDHKAREVKRRKEELLQLFREVNAGEELDKATWDGIEMDDMEAAIQVLAQRMQKNPNNHHAYDNLAEAEVVQDDIWMEQDVELDDDGAENVGEESEEMVDLDTEDVVMDVDVDEIISEADGKTDEEKVVAEPQKRKQKKKIVIG